MKTRFEYAPLHPTSSGHMKFADKILLMRLELLTCRRAMLIYRAEAKPA